MDIYRLKPYFSGEELINFSHLFVREIQLHGGMMLSSVGRQILELWRFLFSPSPLLVKEELDIYGVICPAGHTASIAREQLVALTHSPIDGAKAAIDYRMLPADTRIPISYRDCTHPLCRAHVAREAIYTNNG